MSKPIAAVGLVALLILGTAACRASRGELSADAAAEALRANPGFSTRQGSLVGRQLVEVLAVRRIGQSSTEVEFTWRDAPVEPGRTAPLRSSMALFRRHPEQGWVLTSLYKVD
jgi:hypothetical protein